MLTLGLMEGAFATIGGGLFFLIALNEGASLHKLIAPVIGALVGFAAYTAATSDRAIDNVGQAAGLVAIAVLAFGVPLGVYAWAARALRAPTTAPPPRQAVEAVRAERKVVDVTEPKTVDVRTGVTVRPLQRTRTTTKR